MSGNLEGGIEMTQHSFEQFAKARFCSHCRVEQEFHEGYFRNKWKYMRWSIPRSLRHKKTIRCDEVSEMRRFDDFIVYTIREYNEDYKRESK